MWLYLLKTCLHHPLLKKICRFFNFFLGNSWNSTFSCPQKKWKKYPKSLSLMWTLDCQPSGGCFWLKIWSTPSNLECSCGLLPTLVHGSTVWPSLFLVSWLFIDQYSHLVQEKWRRKIIAQFGYFFRKYFISGAQSYYRKYLTIIYFIMPCTISWNKSSKCSKCSYLTVLKLFNKLPNEL